MYIQKIAPSHHRQPAKGETPPLPETGRGTRQRERCLLVAHCSAYHRAWIYPAQGSFRDALYLRYNWQPTHLPKSCVCGHSFTVDHALSCPTGGLPTVQHNELRDFTAQVMTEVCHNVCTEPPLQPLSGEILSRATATTEDEARLDISAQGFWGNRYQRAFFDVRVFNPNTPTYRKLQLTSAYRRQEREKQLKYEQRIREVELGSFIPGGMSKSTTIAYKRLASLLANQP